MSLMSVSYTNNEQGRLRASPFSCPGLIFRAEDLIHCDWHKVIGYCILVHQCGGECGTQYTSHHAPRNPCGINLLSEVRISAESFNCHALLHSKWIVRIIYARFSRW